MNRKSAHLALLFVMLLPLFAGEATAQEPESTYDRIWSLAQLYRNDDNPVVQSMVLSGRFQLDYARVSDDGVTYDEWNVRRMRFGAKWVVLRELTVHFEADFNPQEHDPFYTRLTDFKIEWSRDETLAIAVGKQSAPFTMDGATSSKELLTIDRSNLANNMWFPQEYVPGVSVSGERSQWSYLVGVYSSGAQNREFGDFSGSGFTLLSLGRDVSTSLGVDRAVLRGNYVYQDPDPANSFTRQLEHMGSLNLLVESGAWGVRTDLSAAKGYLVQSDLKGATLMPYVTVATGVQLVTRYTFLDSTDPNGVRLARYESQHTAGRGDRYQELYLGGNYYFYGHKLKLQSGVQLANMRDTAADGGSYSGVSWTTGLRISW